MKKNALKRGFTLIELMIVIVILGILMGTILPRLTGAQARARDTARKADLLSLSQALEVYYGDNGTYPDADSVPCLDPAGGTNVVDLNDPTDTVSTSKKLAKYLKGEKMPTPPSTAQLTLGGCKGQYYYKPLKTGGVGNASYVLASDVETYQLSNFMVGSASTASSGIFKTSVSAKQYIDKIGPQKAEGGTAASPDTAKSIYVVIP